MADFRVWGRIEPIGYGQFFVIASGVPELHRAPSRARNCSDANYDQPP
jgi:hypothetical protein